MSVPSTVSPEMTTDSILPCCAHIEKLRIRQRRLGGLFLPRLPEPHRAQHEEEQEQGPARSVHLRRGPREAARPRSEACLPSCAPFYSVRRAARPSISDAERRQAEPDPSEPRVRSTMMFAWFKRRRRVATRRLPFPPEWRAFMEKNVPLVGRLPLEDREELRRARPGLPRREALRGMRRPRDHRRGARHDRGASLRPAPASRD